MPGWWVWCGSVIQGQDGKYHMFAARWPKHLPFFEGYIFYSEIVRAVSDTPQGPYMFAEVVLGDRGGQFWDGRMTHNPTVLRYQGKYLLFYIGGTFQGPTPTDQELRADTPERLQNRAISYNSIRIGLAVADDPAGPWVRPDKPYLDIRPGHWDHQVTTNPAPCITPEGYLRLYYRGNTPNGCRIGVAQAKDMNSPPERLLEDPILGNLPLEDPYVFWMDDHYEMLAKDLAPDAAGSITGEYHATVHAISRDGLEWRLAEPAKAASRTVTWDDGKTVTLGCLERPQLLWEDGKPVALFAAAADGPGGFRAAYNTWNICIPLKKM